MHITYTAVLDDNSTAASNYTAGCYAHNISTAIEFDDNSSLGWGTTQSRVWLFDAGDNTLLTKNSPARFTHTFTDGNFSNGVAAINLLFDFNRSMQTPDNPFRIFYSDFNITDVHDLNVTSITGSDFSRTAGNSNESNVTFLYARVKTSRFFYDDVTNDSARTPLFTVVYSSDPTIMVNPPFKMTNDYEWYLNTDHDVAQDGRVILVPVNTAKGSVSVPSGSWSDGVNPDVNVSAVSSHRPLIVDINLTGTDPWLIYNADANRAPSPFYRVRFVGRGGWSGAGKTGHVVGGTINTKKSRRIEW